MGAFLDFKQAHSETYYINATIDKDEGHHRLSVVSLKDPKVSKNFVFEYRYPNEKEVVETLRDMVNACEHDLEALRPKDLGDVVKCLNKIADLLEEQNKELRYSNRTISQL